MNLNRVEGVALVEDVLDRLPVENKTEVVFAPSFMHLHKVAKMTNNTANVFAASQDCSASEKGAFTGEVSSEMIASCGAKYVILGHSERRVNFKETNELLKSKVEQAFVKNLEVIFCCGEGLDKREIGVHFDFIQRQITESLFDLQPEDFINIVIAYEPIWAIGTGRISDNESINEMLNMVKEWLSNNEMDNSINILYGGSVNKGNAEEIFSCINLGGLLVGGVSLKADDFSEICLMVN